MSSTLDVHYIRFVNATYDGEGEFVFPGPPSSRYSGLLPTLQLEGMRDGLVPQPTELSPLAASGKTLAGLDLHT